MEARRIQAKGGGDVIESDPIKLGEHDLRIAQILMSANLLSPVDISEIACRLIASNRDYHSPEIAVLALGQSEDLFETLRLAIVEIGIMPLSDTDRSKIQLLLGSALLAGKGSRTKAAWDLLEAAYWNRVNLCVAHPSLGNNKPSKYAYGELGLEVLYVLYLELSDLLEGPEHLYQHTKIASQKREIAAESQKLYSHYLTCFPEVAKILPHSSSSMSQ